MATTKQLCAMAEDVGAGLIGCMFCSSLYGVTLAQTIVYFKSFPADANWIKFLVSLLCIVDSFHVYLIFGQFWYMLVIGRSIGPTVMSQMPWQLPISFVISYTVTFVVQGFFCWRVRRMGHNNRLATGIIAAAALVQLGSGMVFAVHSIIDRSPQGVFHGYPNLAFKIELFTSLLCDVMISGSLIYYFRANFGVSKRTETILQKLIYLSVNQGVLLGLVTISTLVLFYVKAGTFLAMPSQFILSKLYVNCLLATLNARKELREIADQNIYLSMSHVTVSHDNVDNTYVSSS